MSRIAYEARQDFSGCGGDRARRHVRHAARHGPDLTATFLQLELRAAEAKLLSLVAQGQGATIWGNLCPKSLAFTQCANPSSTTIAARLRKEGKLEFPDWRR